MLRSARDCALAQQQRKRRHHTLALTSVAWRTLYQNENQPDHPKQIISTGNVIPNLSYRQAAQTKAQQQHACKKHTHTQSFTCAHSTMIQPRSPGRDARADKRWCMKKTCPRLDVLFAAVDTSPRPRLPFSMHTDTQTLRHMHANAERMRYTDDQSDRVSLLTRTLVRQVPQHVGA